MSYFWQGKRVRSCACGQTEAEIYLVYICVMSSVEHIPAPPVLYIFVQLTDLVRILEYTRR